MDRDYNNDIVTIYDKIAMDYYQKREGLALKNEMDKFQGLLNGNKILDAGCGNGRDASLFNSKGLSVTGVDLSEGQLAIAKNRKLENVSFYKMSLLDLDFKPCLFDGIWCCTVLPHFKYNDILTVLHSFHTILKDRGILFFTLKKGKGEAFVDETEFENVRRFTAFYDEDDVNEMAAKSEFEIIDIYTYNDQEKFNKSCRDLDVMAVFLCKR